MNRISKFIKAGILVLTGAVVFACNKPFNNPLPPVAGSANNAVAGGAKVLLIVVDGAVGTEVQKANPKVLNSLVDFSIYSWNSLNNYKNTPQTNELGWATLLTGVKSEKHNITGSNFSTNDFATYPTLFTRFKAAKSGLRTAAFCSTTKVVDSLAADATVKGAFANDAATKDAVVAELNTQSPSFVLAQFKSVDIAGAATSYSATSSSYKDSILQVDDYIGKILDAVRARPTFKNENWMVIITSNKGSNTVSTANPWTAFGDTGHNTFFFCYNPRFNSKMIPAPGTLLPYVGTAPTYGDVAANNNRATAAHNSRYDIGTGEFTVWCKVKGPAGTNQARMYGSFFGKKVSAENKTGTTNTGTTDPTLGWSLAFSGTAGLTPDGKQGWRISMMKNSTTNIESKSTAVVFDDKWHSIAMVIRNVSGTRTIYLYTDGVKTTGGTLQTLASTDNIVNTLPLTIGGTVRDDYRSNWSTQVTDMRIYNTALSDDYISSNYCKTYVDPSDPYYGNLQGFWPGFPVVTEAGVNKLKDLSQYGNDLILQTNTPRDFSGTTNNVCPLMTEEVYTSVPNSVDIATQIYNWMGINIKGWGLDGKMWMPNYADIN